MMLCRSQERKRGQESGAEVTDCEEKLDRLEEEGASDEETEKAQKGSGPCK